jgi:hypothetical protein
MKESIPLEKKVKVKILGTEKGKTCNRNGCTGIIDEEEKRSCSCHINPPCSSCTDDRAYCPECGWSGREEQIGYEKNIYKKTQPTQPLYKTYTEKLNELDKTKFGYIAKGHTHFSMIKEGFFEEGMTRRDVYEKVKGTFGGRFEYFRENSRSFKFIAYTD